MAFKRRSPMPVVEGGTGAQTLTGVLTGNGTSAITANTITQNSLQVGGASNTLTQLGVATNGQIPIGSTGSLPVLATITSSTGISIANGAGSITIATVGAVARSFQTDSGTATPSNGILKVFGDGNNIATSGSGNTVTTSLAGITNHSLQVGGSANNLTQLGVATNGQIPIGSTGADPVLATITAGSGISVTNGAGSISIATTGSGGLAWSAITADQTAAVNNGYICNKAGLLTLTLPGTAAVGDTIEVTGINTDLGWKIALASGQTIYFGSSATTTTTGSLASTLKRDSVRLICVVANTDWNVLSSVGNITVV